MEGGTGQAYWGKRGGNQHARRHEGESNPVPRVKGKRCAAEPTPRRQVLREEKVLLEYIYYLRKTESAGGLDHLGKKNRIQRGGITAIEAIGRRPQLVGQPQRQKTAGCNLFRKKGMGMIGSHP